MRRSSQHMAGLCCVDSSVFVFAVMVKQSLNITTLKRVLVLRNSSTFLRNTSSTPSPTSSSTTSTMPQVGNTSPSATMRHLIDCQTKTEMTLQNVHNWFLVTQKFYLLFSGIVHPSSPCKDHRHTSHMFSSLEMFYDDFETLPQVLSLGWGTPVGKSQPRPLRVSATVSPVTPSLMDLQRWSGGVLTCVLPPCRQVGDKSQRADLHEAAGQRLLWPRAARQVEGSAQGGNQDHQRGRHVGGGLHRGGQGHDVSETCMRKKNP